MTFTLAGNWIGRYRCVYSEWIGENCPQYETIGCCTNGIRKGLFTLHKRLCLWKKFTNFTGNWKLHKDELWNIFNKISTVMTHGYRFQWTNITLKKTSNFYIEFFFLCAVFEKKSTSLAIRRWNIADIVSTWRIQRSIWMGAAVVW